MSDKEAIEVKMFAGGGENLGGQRNNRKGIRHHPFPDPQSLIIVKPGAA